MGLRVENLQESQYFTKRIGGVGFGGRVKTRQCSRLTRDPTGGILENEHELGPSKFASHSCFARNDECFPVFCGCAPRSCR
jgi:hypothetical protein